MAEKLTDILTYVLSVALAAAVIAFAAYKVVKLNAMENPPANMGLNFPPAKRKVITDDAPAADPMITQSLGSPDSAESARPYRVHHAARAGDSSVYELLTVVDGVAFVAVDTAEEKTLVSVVVGARLPGGPRVEAIAQHDGRWTLQAGRLVLEQIPIPLQ